MAGRQLTRSRRSNAIGSRRNQSLAQAITVYRRDAPEVAAAFSGLAQAATRPGALDPKTKELIVLAIGVAGRCDGCVGFHTQAALRHGASRAEVLETIGGAIYMGGGPRYVYGCRGAGGVRPAERRLSRPGDQQAAASRAKPASRSAIRSAGSSRPAWIRRLGYDSSQAVAVR